MRKYLILLLAVLFTFGCVTDGGGKVKGKTLDVTDFGAVAGDPAFDNAAAFKAAVEKAEAGDEIYVPEGDWYFQTGAFNGRSYKSHIYMKEGVNLRGAGQDLTRIVSKWDEGTNSREKTAVILCLTMSNIVISDLTVTSDTPESSMPDPNDSKFNNFAGTAPVYGIVLDNERPTAPQGNITVTRVTIEKFQRMGIRLRVLNNVLIKDCTLQDATDLGGGGAGYGISIQGIGNGMDLTDSNLDTTNNRVEGCTINGPYIRHGILLQYYAHHNVITGNTLNDTLLDAIDLHGEDEYANEISFNTINNTRAGAGIGVGNSGATHDAAGPDNYIHDNIIDGGKRGIDVLYGTPNTIVENNVIKNLSDMGSTGIHVQDAPGTQVIGNTLENIPLEVLPNDGPNPVDEGWGIKLSYTYKALEPEKGILTGVVVKNNTVTNVMNGMFTEVLGEGCEVDGNEFAGTSKVGYVDNTPNFVVPPISDLITPKTGTFIYPLHDTFITNEARTRVQTASNMKFKASYFDVPYNRMIYFMFDLTEGPADYDKVYLRLSGKSKDGLATVNIHGSTEFVNWNENGLTWENAPFHADQVAIVEDPEGKLDDVTDFTFTAAGQNFNTYYVDITDYLKSLDAPRVTLILSNDGVENMYCEFYSKENKSEKFQPGLVYTK
ncbi:MAG: right-handed parallel beta-helix repeat-containing protein [Spirochaetales bacterium]|nr:right-handed parallel beta-helix repeat-containing protein [Spirochaetales bacterium]